MIATVEVPLDKIEIPGFVRDFTPLNDVKAIIYLLRNHNTHYLLEIGTNKGTTTKYILDNVPTIKEIWTIDLPPGADIPLKSQKNEHPGDKIGEKIRGIPNVHQLVGNSHDFDYPFDRFDAVFIDGDHSKTGVIADFKRVLHYIIPGALIIFHDYNNVADVNEAIRELDETYPYDFYNVKGTWVAYTRTTYSLF